MIRDWSLTDREFVERTIKAVEVDDRVWLAYALGTLHNVDTSWPALTKALKSVTLSDLLETR